ncbi:uncharacterized protein [Diadema antillarum]|uniref:uncharacterized protein n=1 Tax=Diadema antillarum TaxID=105358 RepID=UPI003A8A6709
MEESVPVVDFSAYSLEKYSPDPERIHRLVDDVFTALTTIGFMYLKNHGISQEKVNDVFKYSGQLFSLPNDVKLKCGKSKEGYFGYLPIEHHKLDPSCEFFDMKESLVFRPAADDVVLPEQEVPELEGALSALFEASISLHNRVLEVMAMALRLDPQFFREMYTLAGKEGNITSLCSLSYPPLTSIAVKEGQMRCGEHSDYGGITLLYQDDRGGLEVKNRRDEWIQAPPIEGTVLVNIGDLMQRWTSDRFIACKHRVKAPDDPIKRHQERKSIAFFGNPDSDAIVECVDGSNKYPAVRAIDYLNMKLREGKILSDARA